MPAIALGYYATPAFMRLTRAGMLEVSLTAHMEPLRVQWDGLLPTQ